MSDPLVLNEQFAKCAHAYVTSFTQSYWKYGDPDGQNARRMLNYAVLYARAIQRNFGPIGERAEGYISAYLARYNVSTEEGVDAYKVIYFLGKAIYEHLPGIVVLQGVHLYTMVGLLDRRLRLSDPPIEKRQLVTALTTVVKEAPTAFFAELGETGCYLIYKCVSTTKSTPLALVHSAEDQPVKGHGLDTQRGTVAEQVAQEASNDLGSKTSRSGPGA